LSFKNKFPYISVIDEASNFKFGLRLRFAKARHQISLEKVDVVLGWGAPQNFVFPYNISATAGASNFKFGTQLMVCQGPS